MPDDEAIETEEDRQIRAFPLTPMLPISPEVLEAQGFVHIEDVYSVLSDVIETLSKTHEDFEFGNLILFKLKDAWIKRMRPQLPEQDSMSLEDEVSRALDDDSESEDFKLGMELGDKKTTEDRSND